jgi:hypothetical protein
MSGRSFGEHIIAIPVGTKVYCIDTRTLTSGAAIEFLTKIRNRAVHTALPVQDRLLIEEMGRKVPGIRLTVLDLERGHEPVQGHPGALETHPDAAHERGLGDTAARVWHAGPPRLGQLLLQFVLPLQGRNAVLGNMAEIYAENARDHGLWYARAVYWTDFSRSLLPIIKHAAGIAVLKWVWNRLRGA